MDDLERWGNADTDEVGRKSGWHRRDDGYWTPWHLADAMIRSFARQVAEKDAEIAALHELKQRQESQVAAWLHDIKRAEAERDALRKDAERYRQVLL